MSDKLRDPIEDRWKSTLWENNPELLEYTSSLERKLKVAEEALEKITKLKHSIFDAHMLSKIALSAIREG